MSPGGLGWNKSRCLCPALEGPRGASSSIPKFSTYTQHLTTKVGKFPLGHDCTMATPGLCGLWERAPRHIPALQGEESNTAVDFEGITVGAIEGIVTFIVLKMPSKTVVNSSLRHTWQDIAKRGKFEIRTNVSSYDLEFEILICYTVGYFNLHFSLFKYLLGSLQNY